MRLNGEALVENSVTPSTVRPSRTLEVAVGDLLLNDLNPTVITRTDDTGVLYYTAHLDLRLFASDVEATSRGITVTREYFLADHSETPVTTGGGCPQCAGDLHPDQGCLLFCP